MVAGTENIEDFKAAIHRYKHLLRGGEIDYDAAIRVESIELEIIRSLESDENILRILAAEPLERALARLRDRVEALILEVAARMGEEGVDPARALEAFYTGDTSVPGFSSALVVVQAFARLKARLYEDSKGIIRNTSPVCPVCGALSKTMQVGEGEEYYMICPFCGYKWLVSKGRLVCPYCGNSDALSVGIFSGKKTKRLGLAWCQKCGSTWRVILDTSIRVPRLLLPLIAHGAEIYRPFIRDSAGRSDQS